MDTPEPEGADVEVEERVGPRAISRSGSGAGRLATPVELQKTPAQGASTTVLLATSPQLQGIGGRYFNDNQEAVPVDERPSDINELVGSVAAYALDHDNADRLWRIGAAAIA